MSKEPQKRSAVQSTLAVPRELSDQIRALADEHHVSVYELTAAILKAGLDSGKIEVQVRRVHIDPAKPPEQPKRTTKRG